MYGKEVRGIERSTFLLDAKGVLRREFRGVKVQVTWSRLWKLYKRFEARYIGSQ